MLTENNWISLYVFYDKALEKIIAELLKPVVDYLEENDSIKSFFFIRYFDGGQHIRLRVLLYEKAKRKKIENFLVTEIDKFFRSSELIYSIKHEDYIRELDRYGGIECISIAEGHFEDSSRTIIKLINENYNNWEYSMSISSAMQMHLIFAKRIILNIEDAILFFTSVYENRLYFAIQKSGNSVDLKIDVEHVILSFTKLYDNQKNKIDFLVKTIWLENNNEEWQKIWDSNCRDLYNLMLNALNKDLIVKPESLMYFNNKLSKNNRILWTIYESYIHMSNNRLGVRINDEAFIAFLIFNGLKSMEQELLRGAASNSQNNNKRE